MSIVPRPHPKEFRADVVAVARRGDAPIVQIAKDFGISDSCLRNWLHAADVEDGVDAYATNAAIDAHGDDPEFGYRFISDELAEAGHRVSERRVWGCARPR